MIAILAFEISPYQMGNNPMDETTQKNMFGDTFEKLSQYRRAAVLHGSGLINDQQKQHFDNIRTKRKRYLHLYSEGLENLPKDAISVFQATVQLVTDTIGQDIKQGKIVLNPAMQAYLLKKDVMRVVPDENS